MLMYTELYVEMEHMLVLFNTNKRLVLIKRFDFFKIS